MEEMREEVAEELRYQDHGNHLSFARGGPIFAPGLVGPLTLVPDFKASMLNELQSLQSELVLAGDFEQELSVDELRVLTEEELVEKALKEDSEEVPGVDDSPLLLEDSNGGIVDHCISGKEIVCSTNSTIESSNLDSFAILNGSYALTCGTDVLEKNLKKKKGTKRG